jgi:hypothetical protein
VGLGEPRGRNGGKIMPAGEAAGFPHYEQLTWQGLMAIP